MELTHDGKIEDILPIFAIPSRTAEQTVRNVDMDKGLFQSSKNLFSKILNDLHNIITPKAKAQSVAENVQTLLSSNACVDCNLAGADLSSAHLSEADLTGANLTGACLELANLTAAVLREANLTGVTLGSTIFDLATWCNAPLNTCTCAGNSIDNCVGCASIDICVGPPLS